MNVRDRSGTGSREATPTRVSLVPDSAFGLDAGHARPSSLMVLQHLLLSDSVCQSLLFSWRK